MERLLLKPGAPRPWDLATLGQVTPPFRAAFSPGLEGADSQGLPEGRAPGRKQLGRLGGELGSMLPAAFRAQGEAHPGGRI